LMCTGWILAPIVCPMTNGHRVLREFESRSLSGRMVSSCSRGCRGRAQMQIRLV
jgi:hypothetical protein